MKRGQSLSHIIHQHSADTGVFAITVYHCVHTYCTFATSGSSIPGLLKSADSASEEKCNKTL